MTHGIIIIQFLLLIDDSICDIHNRKPNSLMKKILDQIIKLTLILLLAGITGCSTVGYYWQAANGHLSLVNSKQDIKSLLATTHSLTDKQEHKLRYILELRHYAAQHIGLPVDNAYSSYVPSEPSCKQTTTASTKNQSTRHCNENKERAIVWNVFAAKPFSLEPKSWCYPVIGCAHYRGYFKREAAEAHAHKIQQQGYETLIGGATAYSTLGWFSDPVLHGFLELNEVELAALLFHELTHRAIYINGDTAFNESLATAIEQFMLERWLNHLSQREFFYQTDGTNHDLAKIDLKNLTKQHNKYLKRQQTFAHLISEVTITRSELKTIYTSDATEIEKSFLKEQTFKTLKTRLEAYITKEPAAVWLRQWATDLNNAKLIPVQSYNQWVAPLREQLIAQLDSNACQWRDSDFTMTICKDSLAEYFEKLKKDRLKNK